MAESAAPSGEDGPPPGFEDVRPGTFAAAEQVEAKPDAAVEELSAAVAASARVTAEGEDVDAPDASLKSGVLLEAEEEEIKTVLAPSATPYASAKTFEELQLSPELLMGLYKEMGFSKPSRVQAETLPLILSPPYRNLVAQAHNGSGKTTCFVLGMLSRVDVALRQPQALCVCPTRELVVQNVDVLRKMGKHTTIGCTSTAAFTDSHAASRMPPIVDQVVIGTPGRLNSWIARKTLPCGSIRLVVFDEADQMWEEYAADCLKILKAVVAAAKKHPQVLLFSATFSDKMAAVARRLVGGEANTILLPAAQLSLDVIKQYRVDCPRPQDKDGVLTDMILAPAEKLGQTIVFVKTRANAHRLHRLLADAGHTCTSIAGDLAHERRDAVIAEFRSGVTKILIATDVLARGFDHGNVTLVVNYDPPTEGNSDEPAFATYMHRIGRSGRFGRKGAAFNLVAGPRERAVLDAIAAHFARTIEPVAHNDAEGFEQALKQAGLA